MYAAKIELNKLTGNNYIPCGSSNWVKLDGRKSLENLINDACEHFKGNFVGVALFKNISDNKPLLSTVEYKEL